MAGPELRYGTPAGRWVVVATVLGSGVAFLDGSVVNVALPAIGRDLHASISALQWILDSYLLTLSALLLLGGSLGDIYGRKRVYIIGLVAFTVASLLCGVAPNAGALVAARALQGVGGALLVPGSLAILSAAFRPDDRPVAISAWAGLAGVASAVGPFVGGWLVQAVSWRLVFFINLPVAAVAVLVTARHVPETRDEESDHRPDIPGAVSAALGLGGLTYVLIEARHLSAVGIIGLSLVAAAAIVAFAVVELRSAHPMLPFSLFKSRQFTGANLTTLAVYAGLGGAFFLLVLMLQDVLGYKPVPAGAALLPVTFLVMILSARSGALSRRIGPRLPMTVGPIVMAAGFVLVGRLHPGDSYWAGVLPGVVLLGLGLTLVVGPLTAAVLATVEERHLGAASAANNMVARVAGLLAVALLPGVAGMGGAAGDRTALLHGFGRAMDVTAALCVAGGLVAFATIRQAVAVTSTTHPSITTGCQARDLCQAESAA
ncbi:MAG: MFS transporter [Actinobacteria bacterium]|nr:MFS transporter [Actinomycetota bacterium]